MAGLRFLADIRISPVTIRELPVIDERDGAGRPEAPPLEGDGRLVQLPRAAFLRGAGFGCRLGEIARELPEAAASTGV